MLPAAPTFNCRRDNLPQHTESRSAISAPKQWTGSILPAVDLDWSQFNGYWRGRDDHH